LPLSISERKGKKYIYYPILGSKRLYLGKSDKPKKENVEEAMRHVRSRIGEYEIELRELENLLNVRKEEREAENPFYKLVFFDLDGVLYDKPWIESTDTKVAVSTWDVLFTDIKMYEVHEKLKQNYINGIYDYMGWTEAACNVLKSLRLDRETFQKVIASRPLSQGSYELLHQLHEKNIKTALVTGSFEALATRASKELGGFDHIKAHCTLYFDENGFLEKWKLEPVDYVDKETFVKEIASLEKIPLEKCAYVGDDVNDVDAFKNVGLAIAFNAKKLDVLKEADIIIESRDLMAIFPHLIHQREKIKPIKKE